MALGAVGSELSAVNVRVTIGAVLPYVSEDWFYMALRAGDFLVQPAERIARRVVIEFGDRADRTPARIGVTILTRNGQGAMRTSGTLPLCGSRRRKKSNQNGGQNQIPERDHCQFTAPKLLGIFRPWRRVTKGIDST